MVDIKELSTRLASGEVYNNVVSIRAVDPKEGADATLVVRAVANKFVDDNGIPVEDAHGTVLTPATLDTSTYLKNNSVVLAHHDPKSPVGLTRSINMKDTGMEVVLEIYKDTNPEIYNQVKRGVLNALSVGMVINDAEYSALLDAVVIRNATLMEISLVTNPSNPLSFIDSVDMCSLGVCSAIRSTTRAGGVDKEAFKAMIKQMAVDGDLDALVEVLATTSKATPIVNTDVDNDNDNDAGGNNSDNAKDNKLAIDNTNDNNANDNNANDNNTNDNNANDNNANDNNANDNNTNDNNTNDNNTNDNNTNDNNANDNNTNDNNTNDNNANDNNTNDNNANDTNGNDIATPNVTFEDKLSEAAKAFAAMTNGDAVELTPEQVNLLTFIVMNYGSIEQAVKKHLGN